MVLGHLDPILYRLLGHVGRHTDGVCVRSRRCSAVLWVRLCYVSDHVLLLTSYRFWSKVNQYTHTPVNAVWLVVLFSVSLDCIGIGSTQTVISIFNITAPALDLSYIAVILAHLVYERRVQFIEGPYTLGKWGKPVNIMAIAWVIFISVVLFFPTVKPVTASNM